MAGGFIILKNQLRRRNGKEVRAMACKGKGKGGKKGKGR